MIGKSDPFFIIAGGCAHPESRSNLLTLGKIEISILLALYKAVDLVLIPLKSGSGSSMKTIEAMAAGCTLLGTTVGFRTLNVASDHQVIIEDDLDKYPQIIRCLLGNPKKCQSLGKEAQIWAQEYDYRKEFKKYLDILGISRNNMDLAVQKEKEDLRLHNELTLLIS